WAFGIILHELLTGRQPFEGKTPFELTSAILRELPIPLPARVPAGLRVIRDNCLAKNPGDRYQNGAELLLALRAVRSGHRVRRHEKSRSRHIVTAAGALIVIALLTGWGLLTRSRSGTVSTHVLSLAVLPFRDTSAETEAGYFGDGVSEALIDRLGTL